MYSSSAPRDVLLSNSCALPTGNSLGSTVRVLRLTVANGSGKSAKPRANNQLPCAVNCCWFELCQRRVKLERKKKTTTPSASLPQLY